VSDQQTNMPAKGKTKKGGKKSSKADKAKQAAKERDEGM
jgi:hypothetical protein